MIEPAQNPRVRQVVIALDNAGSTVTACEAALELAVELRAELHGLFVEDVDLLRASALPFVQEIGVPSARLQPFTVESVERELQAIGERARALLAKRAGEAKIEWNFHVRRDSFPRAFARPLKTPTSWSSDPDCRLSEPIDQPLQRIELGSGGRLSCCSTVGRPESERWKRQWMWPDWRQQRRCLDYRRPSEF